MFSWVLHAISGPTRGQTVVLNRSGRTRVGVSPECDLRLEAFGGHAGVWFEVEGRDVHYDLHVFEGGPSVWRDCSIFRRERSEWAGRLSASEVVCCGPHRWMFMREDEPVELYEPRAAPARRDPATHALALESVGGKAGGRELLLPDGMYTLGSSPQVDLFVPDARVPELALQIEAGPRGDVVTALAEPVLVNLQALPVGSSRPLERGDRVRCGDTDFVVGTRPRNRRGGVDSDRPLNQRFEVETSSERVLRESLAFGVQLIGASNVLTYTRDGRVGRPLSERARMGSHGRPRARQGDEKPHYWEICRIAAGGELNTYETACYFETLDEMVALVEDRIQRVRDCEAAMQAMDHEGPYAGCEGIVKLGYRLKMSWGRSLSLALCHLYYGK